MNSRKSPLTFPVIEYAKTLLPHVSLKNTCVIAIQHLMETTHAMFQSWYRLNLKPSQIHVLGKCYSTHRGVAEIMKTEGIHVSPLSHQFDSHLPYDCQFDGYVTEFIHEFLSKAYLKQFQKLIVLDDGGHLIQAIVKRIHDFPIPIAAVEQTSSGYDQIKTLRLSLPVVNVARAEVKLKYEAPMVAEVAVKRTLNKLHSLHFKPKNILIMGNGVIGSALKKTLNGWYEVNSYDKASPNQMLESILPHADLVLGCTGSTSIPAVMHPLLKKRCVLASVSSSDREFDSVYIRKRMPIYSFCHADVDNREVVLLNSGFPINFSGEKNSVQPKKIQLVRALLTLGVLQATQISESQIGLIDLHRDHQLAIAKEYCKIQGIDSPSLPDAPDGKRKLQKTGS